jgi:hypothetical protein
MENKPWYAEFPSKIGIPREQRAGHKAIRAMFLKKFSKWVLQHGGSLHEFLPQMVT